MAEYLGSLGRLVRLDCASTEQTSRSDRYILQGDATGGVRAALRPRTPRSWDISVGVMTDRDLAALEGFAEGEWGNGPWHWVSISAQHGNLLTPAESLCMVSGPAGLPAGPMLCADDTWAGRSLAVTYTGTGWSVLWDQIPVLPGRPVTFSADVRGTDPQIAISFVDADGEAVGSHAYSSFGTGRVSVTATPPAGAASARAGIRASVTRLARPQVTWGDALVPWTTGKGCRKAIPLSVSSALLWSPSPGKGLSDAQVTIQELS